jgi:tetratricopeptide (TPR) repeat protein
MPDSSVRKVTIFVSSPTDVMAERERAGRVIDRLQSRFREHVRIEPIFFEEKEKYYTADKSFQEQIPDAGASDLVISILWSKLGSELPADLFGTMPDGHPYPGGAVYELVRALEARRAKSVPDIIVYRKVANTGISVTDPDQRRLMNAQLDAFEAFWRQWFVSREGHFRAGFQTFGSTDDFEHRLEGHLRAWLDEQGLLGKEVIWRINERGSPFRGLEPYEMQHADVFFGREREIDRGRDRLLATGARGTNFLLIMGPSGSGKSSLARAGLVTRLTQPGDIDGIDLVRFAVMRPGEGATPQRALAEALFRTGALPELSESDFPDPERLAAVLTGETTAAVAPILRTLDRLATRLKAERNYDRAVEARLLLVVDQLEELFSGAMTDAMRTAFVRLIAALARSGKVFVIATLRSSSYGSLAREAELVALKDAGATLDVAVPGAEVLAEIVRRPAAAAGLVFERRDGGSLDEALLTAAGGNADALPLLGFTLQSLFAGRDGELLTFAAYERLGGLEGAIGRAAEEAFGSVDQEAQAALPRLLRGLAEAPRRGGGLSLRDMPIESAPEGTPLRRLADALLAARVLLSHGEGQGAMLRLAHDAVLRGWERARDITGKEQDFYRIREDVAAAEQRWRGKQLSDLLLAPGLPLAEAQSLRTTYGAELAPEVVAFIDASTRKEQRRQRRGHALAAVFGLVALAALGAGFVAWQLQQEADRERVVAKAEATRADRNFAAAKSTIDAVLFDLAQGLQNVEGMRVDTVRRILSRAEQAVTQLASRTGDDPEVRRSQGAMFRLFADTYLRLGATQLATEYAEKAAAIFRDLTSISPDNARWRNDLTWSLNTHGDVLSARGDIKGAIAAYRESLDNIRALSAKEPDNDEWRRDISVGLNRVGDLLVPQGDLTGALTAYREGLAIIRALSAKNPRNTLWRRDVSYSLYKVGDVLATHGDLNGALAAYREGLEIRRELSASDPGNTQWRFDVSVSLERIGNVLRDQGDLKGSLDAYREGLAMRQALAAKDPDNAGWRRDISVGLNKVGDVLVIQGDLTGALAAYREGLAIIRALSAKDTGNTGWRRDVSYSLYKVGDVLVVQGDLAGALKAYRESLDIRRKLSASNPANTLWRDDVSLSLERVADVLRDQGDLVEALAAYRESLDIRRKLWEMDNGNTGWRRDTSVGLNKVGDVLRLQGDLAGALAAYREGLVIIRELSAKDPGNTVWRRDVAYSLNKVGDVLRDQRDNDGALVVYREGLDIARELAAKDARNTQWRNDVSISLERIGDILRDRGDLDGALAAYREGLEARRVLLALDAGNTLWRRNVSVGLNRVGDIMRRQGDADGALKAYRESLELMRGLSAINPSVGLWRRDVSLSLERIGDILRERKDLNGALASFRECLEIRRELSTKNPDNTGWRRDVSIALYKVGNVLWAQEDRTGAIAAYREDLEISRELAAKNADNTQWQTDVVISLNTLARAGDEPRARWTEAIAILKRLNAQNRLTAGQQKWIGEFEAEMAKLARAG